MSWARRFVVICARVAQMILRPFHAIRDKLPRITRPISGNSKAPLIRSRLASGWRQLIRGIFVLLGFGILVALQLLLADLITGQQWRYIIGFYLFSISFYVIASRPSVAVILWLVISPWVALFIRENVSRGALSITFNSVILPMLATTLILRALRDRHRFKRFYLAEWFLLLSFISANVVPLIGTHIRIGTLNAPFAFAQTPLAIYFITKASFKDEKQIAWAQVAIVVLELVWGLSGWYEHFARKMWLSSLVGFDVQLIYENTGVGRARGPADHLETYGAVNIMCIYLAWHLAGQAKKEYAKFLYYVSAIVMLLALFFCYTRGPYLAFITGFFVLLLLARRDRRRYLAIGSVLAAIIVISTPLILNDASLSNRILNPGTLYDRVAMNKTAVNIIKSNFWFGVGTGNIENAMAKYAAQMRVGRDYNALTGRMAYLAPHNEYLYVFAERGFLGCFVHFGAIFFLLIQLLRTWARAPEEGANGKGFIATVIAFVVVCLVLMMSNQYQDAPYLYSPLCVLLALGVRVGELNAENRAAQREKSSAAGNAGPSLVSAGFNFHG